MKSLMKLLKWPDVAQAAAALAAVLTAGLLVSQETPLVQVGPLKDGGFLLNSGWVLRPAGEQVAVDTLPMRSALSKDGRFLLVLNAGYKQPSISVIEMATKKETARVPVADAWLGLTFSPSGKEVYAGGGSRAKVYEFHFAAETGELTPAREMNGVADPANKGLSFIGDVAISPDGRLLYAADLFTDSIAVINLQSATLIERWKTGRRPYRILMLPGGKNFLVSGWGDASVYLHDANSGGVISVTRVAQHPTDMLWLGKPAPVEEDNESPYRARLFVAAANTNNVYTFGATSNGEFKPLEAISTALTPFQPFGMTPSALALSNDLKRLFIACSDGNTVAVADITAPHSRVLGFIPTGWYPTSVATMADDSLVILNGKGLGSHPNPHGPNPSKRAAPAYVANSEIEYVGRIQTGTVGFVPPPTDEQLTAFTETVRTNSPYKDDRQRERVVGPQSGLFVKSGEHQSPIRHVIYIIKENRTYDQVLGDIGKGNSDPSLTLFGENVTPNLHQIARDFILYDNFYENSDVSADGHNWATSGIAPDYTVKLWPNSYAQRRKTYDYEGGEPANSPPAGYIWNNALAAGVTVRNYGDWAVNIPLSDVRDGRQIGALRDPALKDVTDLKYRAFDLNYPDVERSKEFLSEWKEFDQKGDAPQLMVLRMGNDHTQGAAAGKLSPLSYAADNDLAVGMLVDGVSHSKLWSSTAIFIIEDDAQNGPDHVDSHRSTAYVISPYTRRGVVDSTMYNQMSVLHTIEGVLGIHPMTQFDAAAVPMFGSFSAQPNAQPWSVLQPKTSLTEHNPGNNAGAKESARLDFSDADLADDDELNAILWRAIKKTEMPPPVVSMFGSRAGR
ncbi:MAG: bifunctional YncE family protein/alkaline phosphatase family protein [Bryobacteraceae bacterium]